MLDPFNPGKGNPLLLCEELIRASQKDKNDLKEKSDGEQVRMLKSVSLIARQYMRLQEALDKLQKKGILPEGDLPSLQTPITNINSLWERMGLRLVTAQTGPLTNETLRLFDVVTGVPRADITEVMVESTIEPAVLYNSNLFMKGAVQVLQPAQNSPIPETSLPIDAQTPKNTIQNGGDIENK